MFVDEEDPAFLALRDEDQVSTLTVRTRMSLASLSRSVIVPDPEVRSMDMVTYQRINKMMNAAITMSPGNKRRVFSLIREPSVDQNTFLVHEGQFVGIVCFANTLDLQARNRRAHVLESHTSRALECEAERCESIYKKTVTEYELEPSPGLDRELMRDAPSVSPPTAVAVAAAAAAAAAAVTNKKSPPPKQRRRPKVIDTQSSM
jgi:hypothetical protein